MKTRHNKMTVFLFIGFLITNLLIFLNPKISKSEPQKESPYRLLTNFQLSSPRSEVVELEHKQSGARLVLVKNSDPAKTFTVTFRTPPYDDTGIFHVFEHAVMQGSRLYPSKSNILRVMNSSLASQINAYTASVSNYYSFVTKDPKDFDNLLSVYMDAVFFPRAVKDPGLIKREGWRYEVDPETKKMSINGIVFNEIKGKFEKPHENLDFHLHRSVLSQTPYSYAYAGLPEQVITLRFEQFVETHTKYYHPQNSIIYLYGDLDYEKILTTIDESFLRHFHRTPDFTPFEIPFQTGFNDPGAVTRATYPSNSQAPGKDFLVKTYVLGPLSTEAEEIAADILVQIASGSRLKLGVFREGLARSASSKKLRGNNNAYSFIFQGTEASKRERLDEVLDEEFDKLIDQGIDQEVLISSLNIREFSYKNKYSNGSYRGLSLGKAVRNHWLHPRGTLEEHMDTRNLFKGARELLEDESFIKDFFKKYFRDNSRFRWLVMRPDPHSSEKLNAAIQRQIEEDLRVKPLADYEKEDRLYQQWVTAKEPPEITNLTPLPKLSDITVDEQPIPFNKFNMDSTEVIGYPQKTDGISYVKLFFDLRGVKEEDLKNLDLLTSLLMKTDTTNHSHQDLSRQIGIFTGGIVFRITTYQSTKNPEHFSPTLFVYLGFLDENREKSFSLLKEILTESQFSPVEQVALLLKLQWATTGSLSSEGLSLAFRSARKKLFPALGAFKNETSGVSFKEYILNSAIDPEELSSRLKEMLKSIFNRDRFYLATITGEQDELEKLETEVEKLKNSLPSESSGDQIWAFSNQEYYDGFAIPGGEVQSNVEVIPLRDRGPGYSGTMEVYSQYLNTHFMIPRLREEGGAYEAKSSPGHHAFSLSSKRDPNLKQTFDIFSQFTDFMENEDLDQERLRPAILGSLKPYYSDGSVLGKTGLMTSLYLRDRSWDDYIRVKGEILSTTPEDIREINGILASASENSIKSVAGNAKKLKEEALFLKNVLSFQ